MILTVYGFIMIAFGILYLRNQTIFRRGIWLKTSLAIRFMSEEMYKTYIKSLGVIFIITGLGLIVWAQGHRLGFITH